MAVENFVKVKRVLWIILFANMGVAALKIIIGTAINSTSLTADGFHSLADGSSNIVGLIGIKLASKPVDEDHPYGHGKFEILAGLFIAGMLFVIGVNIILEAVKRVFNPLIPSITPESLVALIITLGINIFVSIYEYKQGKKLGSKILISDSLHTRSDIYVSIGVLVTLVGIKFGLPPVIDTITSLVVAGFILHAAYEIFKDNSGVLVDKAVVDSQRVRTIAMSFEQVKDIHNIRSRGSENDLYIDMHIMTDPDMSVEDSHQLIHDIEAKLQQEINLGIQAIIHIEPLLPGLKHTLTGY